MLPGIDRELRELIVSVIVLLLGFWIALKITSGLVWDWSGWGVIEPQSYPPCEAGRFLQFTCSTAWIGMIETIKIAILATFFGMIFWKHHMPVNISQRSMIYRVVHKFRNSNLKFCYKTNN